MVRSELFTNGSDAMPLTDDGALWIAKALMNDSATFYTASNAYLGVGNGGGTAFATNQHDLVGPSKLRKGMESPYPSRSANTVTYRSLFATGEANFVWSEVGLFNGAVANEMFNRIVAALGTKTSAAAWQLTFAITINAV